MDDAALMVRVRDGDDVAFKMIVDKYYQPVYQLCYRYLSNQEDAEEITQDVFIRLYNAASSYEPRAKLYTFLYRIAVNLSLNRIRDRKLKRFISLETLKNNREGVMDMRMQAGPDKIIEQKENQEIIKKAIDSLPASQRTAVILKRYNELSYEEISEVMECSISAVESLLHRAKQKLKKKLNHLIK